MSMRCRGVCRFCGQVKDVVVGKHLTQDEIDKIVASECDCDGAITEKRLADDAAMTESNIKELLEEHPAADILIQLIPLIQHSSVASVAMQLNETTKVTMKTDAKNCLKVAKTVTVKTERKTE